MVKSSTTPRIYDGDGDRFMSVEREAPGERIVLVPDALPSRRADTRPHLRIMWGQHLLDDLVLGRYRSLVCAVNGQDNSHGIIGQLATMLPATQWDERSVTQYARQFITGDEKVKVLKYEMDMLEILAILRPSHSPNLTTEDLSTAFRIVAEMIRRRTTRLPTASVSFLGARANALVDEGGREPSFERVLKIMHDAGFYGDVYPSPGMWAIADVGVYPRFPFPRALDQMRDGGS